MFETLTERIAAALKKMSGRGVLRPEDVELSELIDHIAKLKPAERARHLSLLGAKTVDGLRARLAPRVVLPAAST